MIKKIIKVIYNTLKDETTIFYINSYFGKEKEEFRTFQGKINKKNENPTICEVLEFIKLKGGINKK